MQTPDRRLVTEAALETTETALVAAIGDAADETYAAATATARAEAHTAIATAPLAGAEIVTLGDSITAGNQADPAGGQVVPWPTLVGEYLGKLVYNPSVAGERMGDIAVRSGALSLGFTVPGGTIPATTGAFTVTLQSPGADQFTGSTAPTNRSVFRGRFLGVQVGVRYDGAAWTMWREEPGTAAIPVPAAGGRFRALEGRGNRGAIHLFAGGRNGGSVATRTAEMVGYLEPPARFLVFSQFSGANDGSGSAGYPGIMATNDAMRAAYPNNYLDVRRHLIDHGLAEEGITPTTQDLADIAADTVPASLRVDAIHPNAAGSRVIARLVARTLVEKGWVSGERVFVPEPANQPKYLRTTTPTGTATHVMPAFSGTTFSARVVLNPASLPTTTWTLMAQNDGDGQRLFQLHRLASGVMRGQLFPTGVNTGNLQFDTTTAITMTAGQVIGLGLDVDVAAKTATFTVSRDAGATWQTHQTVAITASTLPAGVSPNLLIRMSAPGDVHSATVSYAGATQLTEDFTDGTATGWTLTGMSYTTEWPYIGATAPARSQAVPDWNVPATSGPLGNRWVFLGDSNTQGATDNANNSLGSSFPLWVQLSTGGRIWMVRNAGIGGDTSGQMLARFDADVAPYQPAVVFLMAGGNDLSIGLSFEQYRANINAIRVKCRDIGATLALSTLFPKNDAAHKPAITQWNHWLRGYAAQHGLHLVDSYDALVDTATGDITAAFNSDGVHLTPAGYRAVGRLVADQLGPLTRAWGPRLVRDGGDTTINAFGSNPVLLTDTNADGIPDGWIAYGGTTGYAHSTVTDPLVPGRLAQITMTGAASSRLLERVVPTASWAVGDRLFFGGLLTTDGGVEAQMKLQFVTANKSAFAARFTGAVTRGVAGFEVVVPTGTTQINYTVIAAAGTGTVSVGRPTVLNLTRLGLV